jgi:2-hydroxyacyl-CoA lyase 1
MEVSNSQTGAVLVANSLKRLGVQVVFGVVGVPVIEVAEACRQQGIRFIAMRNEQSASYAANAWGYLHRQPGVCLAVSGPGFVHALAGLANSQANCWPMLLIAGSRYEYCESYMTDA